MILSDADRAQLKARGIAPEEAERQLELLRRGPKPVRVDRPCRPGDGVLKLDGAELDRLGAAYETARLEGRASKFVPASGAATRMVKALLSERPKGLKAAALEARASDSVPDAKAALEILRSLDRFAFYDRLRERMAEAGADPRDFDAAAEWLLEPKGLGYAERPKALLEFHRYPDGPRTPVEEHLAEAAALVADQEGVARIHLTAAQEHVSALTEFIKHALSPKRMAELGVRHFELGLSVQKPSTETLAIDLEGRPFRLADGSLLLRPGGHGALLDNLGELSADLVFVKNIDNVATDRDRPLVLRWSRALGGLACELRAESNRLLEELRAGRGVSQAAAFFERWFGQKAPDADRRGWLAMRLDRPLRVCGVVPNSGEPGGGPFWVRSPDGSVSSQIVESAELDLSDPSQAGAFASATHFNPVDLACAVRDRYGRPYDLQAYADPDAVFVSRKSHEGRELLALERPGLWNGAMMHWNTVFVEIPAEAFHPAKTLLDLLRPGHV